MQLGRFLPQPITVMSIACCSAIHRFTMSGREEVIDEEGYVGALQVCQLNPQLQLLASSKMHKHHHCGSHATILLRQSTHLLSPCVCAGDAEDGIVSLAVQYLFERIGSGQTGATHDLK